jgi:single-strand DNA-binding protein
MASLTIAGRLGRDCEVRTTQKGTKVTQFSVPVDQGYGDKKTTMWVRCSWFGERGERVAQYLTKGTMVFVTGTPSLNTYEGKDGFKASLECNVLELKLMGTKGDKKDDTPVADNATATSRDMPDDDIPF